MMLMLQYELIYFFDDFNFIIGFSNSILDNPSGFIFGEAIGIVAFDPDGAKYVQSMNKKKDQKNETHELPKEIELINSFISNHEFYCFHGEHSSH